MDLKHATQQSKGKFAAPSTPASQESFDLHEFRD